MVIIGLTTHHMIEERFLFPVLAKRMPQFKAEHLEAHQGIHEGEYAILSLTLSSGPLFSHLLGLNRLKALLSKYESNSSSYSPAEMKACMDSWREVLFKHLDQEVRRPYLCMSNCQCQIDLFGHVFDRLQIYEGKI